jgi:S-adenosylmethionine:diacylglycerol 3-amino-3-carboxypropyl transferase
MPNNGLFSTQGPVLFGQVREDAGVELEMMRRAVEGSGCALVIASGGCTALSLLGEGRVHVDAIDINQAQVALVELKARLFSDKGFDEARHACCTLNNCGVVDRRLEQLAKLFFLGVHSRAETEEFLSLSDISQQQEFYRERWDTWRWRLSTGIAFNRRFLSLARFAGAMKLVPLDFADAMRARFERALTGFPNATNPYVWQTFFNRYPANEEGMPLYLQRARADKMLKNLDGGLRLVCRDVSEHLSDPESTARYDFVALSNVLELLPAEYALQLRSHLISATKPGALILVRSIFPRQSHYFESGDGLAYSGELSQLAESIDRSLFCNFMEVYRRN